MLLDSNILIYGADDSSRRLDSILDRSDLAIASLTRIETLGFHRLTESHKHWLALTMERTKVFDLDEPIIHRAIMLRQNRKMGLADAVIAATALEHGLPLVTRNVDDYKHIDNLRLINPFDP